MDNKVWRFSAYYKDAYYIMAETKKEAAELIKAELQYDPKDPMLDEDGRIEMREIGKALKDISEVEGPTKDFVLLMMDHDSKKVRWMPSFSPGERPFQILRRYAENKTGCVLIPVSEYELLSKSKPDFKKVRGYEKIKERIIKLSEYLKEDEFNAMI